MDKPIKDNEIEQVKQKLENVEKEGKEKEKEKEQEQKKQTETVKSKKVKDSESKEEKKSDKVATDAEIAMVLKKLSEYLEQK